jgi:hypothetical protein
LHLSAQGVNGISVGSVSSSIGGDESTASDTSTFDAVQQEPGAKELEEEDTGGKEDPGGKQQVFN